MINSIAVWGHARDFVIYEVLFTTNRCLFSFQDESDLLGDPDS